MSSSTIFIFSQVSFSSQFCGESFIVWLYLNRFGALQCHDSFNIFITTVNTALRHATMSWYYITAGLFLYALDNAVRLSTTVATLVTVDQLVVELRDIDDNSPAITSSSTNILSVNNLSVETATAGVVKLAYTVASPLMSAGERGPLNHLMGQYVYINIPAISSLEWHPFTISSAPIDHVTTHHIKVMGGLKGNQWTAKLYQLVKSLESAVAGDEEENSLSRRYYHGSAEEKSISHVGHRDANDVSSCLFPISSPFSKLLVNIDGPYGLSVSHELHRYTHLLLVGGGIGVTPLHSCLRHLLLSDACAVTSHKQGAPSNEGLLSKPYPKLEQVRLLWSVKSEEEANLFKSTVR